MELTNSPTQQTKLGLINEVEEVCECSIHKLYLAYTTRQGSRVSCLAQTDFAAFGKGVQLMSGSPFAEAEQLSRLTSPSGILFYIY